MRKFIPFKGLKVYLPENYEINQYYSNDAYWLKITPEIKMHELNKGIDFGFYDYDFKTEGVSMGNLCYECENSGYVFKLSDYKYEAKLVRPPIEKPAKNCENWQSTSYRWLVYINGFEFDYYTGKGWVKTPKHGQASPIKPSLLDVMSSLISDYTLSTETFEEFCDNLGYDNDSIKVLKIYASCQENSMKLSKAIGGITQELIEFFQDY
jgi:hypothetical protein